MDEVSVDPEIPTKAVQDALQKKWEVNVSRMKAFRAKAAADKMIIGAHKGQYSMLRDYVQELITQNPGTTVKCQVEMPEDHNSPTRVFRRIYICLGALKQGFKASRRELLGLDGAFISGPFPVQLSTTVGLDANNGIYPVAYALVEVECKDLWVWFLNMLGDDLDLYRNSNFTFISYRQKGIIQAMNEVFPSAEHKYCLRHIHENMKKQRNGLAYKQLLWRCATATTVTGYEATMKSLKKLSIVAHDWLSKIPPEHWSRPHFSGRAHSDVLLNNMCKVLNGNLVLGRDKPIITLLEFIREYCMKRIVNVQKAIEKCPGPLTPTATTMMTKIKENASNYKVQWNGEHKYQVTGCFGEQCVVDVDRRTCSCRRWEITGIPCKHAVAANSNMVVNGHPVAIPEAWTDKCYWLEIWKEVYSFKVQPLNKKAYWKKSTCLTTLTHPNYHPQVGRPRKKRVRGEMEDTPGVSNGRLSKKWRNIKCSSCGNVGHNKQSCKGQGCATTSGSKKTSKGKGKHVEDSGGASANSRPRKKVRFCLDDDIQGSPSARENEVGRNIVGNDSLPAANKSGQRSMYGGATHLDSSASAGARQKESILLQLQVVKVHWLVMHLQIKVELLMEVEVLHHQDGTEVQ